MADPTNIRVLVPRIRRALEGAGATGSLSDDEVKDVTADAIAEIILYTGGLWGKTLDVAATDPLTSVPTEYTTSDALTLMEQVVVANQTALNYFFFLFAGLKISERIADESEEWEYARSAQLLTKQLDLLVAERDKALAALEGETGVIFDQYSSYLSERDNYTARLIEPFTDGSGFGGLEQDPVYGFPG